MRPWFIATKKFDALDVGWEKYIAWSGLVQLEEVVSLDDMLCPTVLPEIKPEYWSRIVNEDFLLSFFLDVDFLRAETAGIARKNMLCVFRDPPLHPAAEVPDGFKFAGYDLVEAPTGVSALTNCGGFPEAFSNAELSEKGLLRSHERAREVQVELRRRYPGEPHAICHAWAIFR